MAEITSFSGKTTKVDSTALIDTEVARLMARVGERVRHARERRNIPRRVLSEMSGVSPRYLAQLESGEGNISIGLLMRVAMALDFRIEWLVGQEDPWNSDVLRVTEQFRVADRAKQQEILDLLTAAPGRGQRAGRVCLIGLRGAGKSTLGRKLGAALDLPFVELNREIEQTGGMPVDEIMALYGQEGYRKLEADALDRVIATHDRMILAVAGGIVAEPATFNRLLSHFHTIWLKASAQDHMHRVRAQGDERPMAGNPEAMAQLKTILKAREALYERAHAQLDTSGHSVEDSLAQLQALIAEQHFLD
ncbi:helix-turn-helix transcriptional regulator [Tropicibacter naphthalenivorans]|uniref:Shikimate kinase n=1 Tax=Tropicibacter naphthalenivorans TaxID=441103 RepID=A0A0P1GJN9_9RHOB|nr:helix-turn-helix transcriptional regulator [Tropicibacter naphthalenivorans]CUH82085.1 Shikimate kinase [Tropicibacter naphthalenivorans]SMD08482.1 transcriptional regulator, XRE family with shikimate kinase activity [Tropicibacter naphthalenivorans]